MRNVLIGLLATQAGAEASDSTPWHDYVAVGIAALAFLASLVFGILNRRTAKRALDLSQLQESRRNRRLDLYLIGSTARRRGATGDRVLEFNVQVSNPADRASSITAAELHVTYSVAGSVMTTVKVAHSVDSDDDDLATPGIPALDLPARLDANDAISGWLRFRLAGDLLNDREIDRYDIAIRDVHGLEETQQVGPVSYVVA